MKANLFIHPHTKSLLLAAAKRLPHAMLLSGPKGLGLGALSDFVIETSGVKLKAQTVEPDEKNTISIEAIRELYKSTRTKQARRVIVIHDADRMTIAAQNAFLKLLEEPSDNISFMLTSHTPSKLLPTILSRVQHLSAHAITSEQTDQLLDSLKIADAAKRAQLKFIANGLPAEINRLVEDDSYFAGHAQLVRDARELLQAARYQKLLLVNTYGNDRDRALRFISALLQIIHMALLKNPQEHLVSQLEKLLVANERIRENGHIRTQLLRAIW